MPKIDYIKVTMTNSKINLSFRDMTSNKVNVLNQFRTMLYPSIFDTKFTKQLWKISLFSDKVLYWHKTKSQAVVNCLRLY